MEYRYLAYAENRQLVKGTQTAATQDLAAKMLTATGYKLLSIRPIPGFLPRLGQVPFTSKKIPKHLLILFSRQLALLLESGTDLVKALELLRQQSNNSAFRDVLSEAVKDIRMGVALSKAFDKHPGVFPKMYVQSLLVSEQNGSVEAALRQSADYMAKEESILKQTKGAMLYPAAVGVVAIVVVAILTLFVLPQFMKLYGQLGVQLPLLTRIVFDGAAWFARYAVFIFAVIAVAVVGAHLYSKTPSGALAKDRLLLKLPIMGRVVHLTELARCCRCMSTLAKGGLPVPDILGLTIETSENTCVKQAIADIHKNTQKGRGLSEAMAMNGIFLPMMVQMVAIGEASGKLEAILTATADSYETEVADRMKMMIELIQPTITVVLAIVVGLIASAVVSAMYSLYGQLG